MPDRAPGFMSEIEMAELERLAAGQVVLEIGTWKGRSACAMAAVAKEVWCIDTFRGDRYAGRGWFLPEFLENAYKLGVWERIRFLGCPWEDLLPQLDLARFGLVLYDADHDYEPTAAAGRLLVGGCRPPTIAFHDYSGYYPEVIRAVDELAELGGRSVRVVDTLAVLECDG